MKHGVTRERVYRFICDYKNENGYSPSFRDIEKALGIGVTTVSHHLSHLKTDGRITYKPGVARSIVVL